jgi:hypothetical protein
MHDDDAFLGGLHEVFHGGGIAFVSEQMHVSKDSCELLSKCLEIHCLAFWPAN